MSISRSIPVACVAALAFCVSSARADAYAIAVDNATGMRVELRTEACISNPVEWRTVVATQNQETLVGCYKLKGISVDGVWLERSSRPLHFSLLQFTVQPKYWRKDLSEIDNGAALERARVTVDRKGITPKKAEPSTVGQTRPEPLPAASHPAGASARPPPQPTVLLHSPTARPQGEDAAAPPPALL